MLQSFLDGAADGPEIKLPIPALIKAIGKIGGGIFTKKVSVATLKSALEGVSLSGKLKKHYLNFPESPEGYSQWKEKADELWKAVGKMQ